jgi:glycosyltransferase involved in cell wall biosynthesis
VDGIIAPSSWVCELYAQRASIQRAKLHPWPAGVDTDFWKPDLSRTRDSILIYVKGNYSDTQLEIVRQSLSGFQAKIRIIRYGSYTLDEYRDALQAAIAMVCLGGTESQGIYLIEAWSCGVATVVLSTDAFVQKGKRYPASSAPYLSEVLGQFFHDLSAAGQAVRSVRASTTPLRTSECAAKQFSDDASLIELLKIVTVDL